jgi:hypothetical protein
MARKFLTFCLFLLGGLGAHAALLPDDIGTFHRVSAKPVTLTDQALWREYGFQEGETATYQSGDTTFTVTAWRLQDATGALGAFEWQRPADAKASPLASEAAETADGALVMHNNYLISFAGHKPDNNELVALAGRLKNVDSAPAPTLPGFMPSANLVPNSERYILGPVGLAKFAPQISPSTVGFHFGTEAQLARFQTSGGELTLGIFDYPTPQIARQKIDEFNKTRDLIAKRTGPLIAVVPAPKDSDAAERLLAQVRYNANLTLDEYVPTRRDNIGNLVINAFQLIGILLVFAAVAGFAFGGFRVLRRRKGEEADAMITLHIVDR